MTTAMRWAPATAEAAVSGVFASLDLHVADMVARRAGVGDPVFATAVALAAKAVRLEHVCVDVDALGIGLLWTSDEGEPVAAPEPSALLAALVAAGPVVEVVAEGADVAESGDAPIVLSGTRCYLRRYALLEQQVAARLRADGDLPALDGVETALAALAASADASQVAAVRRALHSPVSVIAGGPGTGKTTTIALLLQVLRSLDAPLVVALATPTGKAATRLDQAVRLAMGDDETIPRAQTLHRLLGIGRDGVVRGRRLLEADVVVVDEASMVSLPILAEALGRTRPDARVVLVGDPDQLASIEVGAVLSDIVEAAASPSSGVAVSVLETPHRFAEAAGVAELAAAVRSGGLAAVDTAVAEHPAQLALHAPDARRDEVVEHVVAHAASVIEAARAGDASRALGLVSALGVLCATRRGDGSTEWWRREIERHLVDRGVLRLRDADYVGRPLLVTRNDPLTGLTNGSVGVVVADRTGRAAVFDAGTFPVAAVSAAETVWALTIHKSQGSEYDEVVVSLPGPESPILTRELVYTAVTRSRRAVTILCPPGTLEVALARRVARSSGLAARLRTGAPTGG
jgi:exodeoxyribonuclease V alpha subunit